MNALLFAAGKGTRLKPLTDTKPKALVEVGGRPLIDIVLKKLIKAGASEIVVNVHHFGEQIKDYFLTNDYGIPVRISDESAELLETGGGLRKAAPLFHHPNNPILLHNVDILSNANLAELYRLATDCDALLLVSERLTTRYLLFDNEMQLKGWTNIKTGEVRTPFSDIDIARLHHFAFSGIHVFSHSLLPLMQTFPKKFSIIDFYLSVCSQTKIKGCVQPGLRLLDVGKQDTLETAKDFLKTTI